MYYPELLVMNCERIVKFNWPEWADKAAQLWREEEAYKGITEFLDHCVRMYKERLKVNEKKIVNAMCRQALTKKEQPILKLFDPENYFRLYFDTAAAVLPRVVKRFEEAKANA